LNQKVFFMTHLHIPPNIRAIIFDKDGTLIDFDAMWAGWIVDLARHLEAAAYISIAPQLFQAVGFDPSSGAIDPSGPLAIATMDELRALVGEVLRAAGLTPASVAAAIKVGWVIPDPVALARPLADLAALFGALRARGLRIAVATSDNHAPTVATLAALGVAELVDAVVGADDGVPIKPAPDMIFKVCNELGIEPAQTIMVGDSPDDLRMGRAAGAGLVVGVLSGLSSAELLGPLADVLLPSVAGLMVNTTKDE
jgi:phosphoglycolate phosphatase-like HAD superfamily hydrolase